MLDWDARATAQRVQAIEPSGCDRVFQGWDISIAIEDFMSQHDLQGWCCERMFFCRGLQGRPAHVTGHWTGTTPWGGCDRAARAHSTRNHAHNARATFLRVQQCCPIAHYIVLCTV